MLTKHILPESFSFDVPSVDIIGCGRHGLDAHAMHKRASAFDDIIADIQPQKNRAYLHVITTGAMETYGANRNGDAFNEYAHSYTFPEPEDSSKPSVQLQGGLTEYHDSTYMGKAAVYQEHKTTNTDPSGEIIAAKYNTDMHRGELIIAVDTDKWRERLSRKANGSDIYLSMGCSVPFDICSICGHKAKTMDEHCEHFKKHKCRLYDSGVQSCVINDAPRFYDISGVNVPADRIAFVLRKVASGEAVKEASYMAPPALSMRNPLLLTKTAARLMKLSAMEKQLDRFMSESTDAIEDTTDSRAEDVFKKKVHGFDPASVIAMCNGKGILLSPSMLFSLLGDDSQDEETRDTLKSLDDTCCGDCSAMLRELSCDEDCDAMLADGSFDGICSSSSMLSHIIDSFIPDFCMHTPVVNRRIIRVTIKGPGMTAVITKKASVTPPMQETLRRTYARYVLSFACANSDDTCMNALRKIAEYGK